MPNDNSSQPPSPDTAVPAVGEPVTYCGSITALHGDVYEVAAHEPPNCECHHVALRLIDPGYEDVRGGELRRVRPESVRPLDAESRRLRGYDHQEES